MVCMTSRIGRSTFQTRSLRAATMPAGMPITAQNSTEVMIMASVVIVCGHSPIMSMKMKPTRVKIAMVRPDHFQAASANAAVVKSMGRTLKKLSSQLRTKVTGTCAARKAGRKLGTSQPRTKSLIQSSKGMMRRSPGLSIGALLGCNGFVGLSRFCRRAVFGRLLRLLAVAGQLGKYRFGLDDADQPVTRIGHRDGQSAARRAVKGVELRVRVDGRIFGDHRLFEDGIRRGPVERGGGQVLIGDHAGYVILLVHDIERIAVEIFHGAHGVVRIVSAQLHGGGVVGNVFSGEDASPVDIGDEGGDVIVGR